MANVRWKTFPLNKHYAVSERGGVQSDFYKHRPFLKPFEFTCGPRHQKHQYVTIRIRGKRRCFNIAQMVLLTFVGPPPKGKPLALHWDDNPRNNALGNLYWGSHAENWRDATRNGIRRSVAQWVMRAIKLRHDGKSLVAIGKELSVNVSSLSTALKRYDSRYKRFRCNGGG